MKIEQISIEKLIPYSFNNKKHSITQVNHIANSIKEFGFNQPIVIDEDNVVLVGHGRLEAAKKLGLETVPVYKHVGLTETQKKAYRILDNKLAGDAEWDFDNIKVEFEFLEEQNFPFEDFGLEFDFLNEDPVVEVSEDDFNAEIEEETYIKTGDLIRLGRHTVLCGDCTDSANWIHADVCFSSPPYNRGGAVSLANKQVGKNSYRLADDNLSDGEYRTFLGKVTANATQYTKVSALNIQMLAGNKIDLICWLDDFHHKLIDIGIWNKRLAAPAVAKNVMTSVFEFIFLFSNEDYPTRAISTSNFHGDKPNVFNIDPSRSLEFAHIHAATMPIKFASAVLDLLGGDSVIDCFLGTGTTLIAAEQMGKSCYGIELDPVYCQVIIERYKKYCIDNNKKFECTINGTNFDGETGAEKIKADSGTVHY